MTKRKDPLPEADTPPEATPPTDAAVQPFVVTDPVDPPPAEIRVRRTDRRMDQLRCGAS